MAAYIIVYINILFKYIRFMIASCNKQFLRYCGLKFVKKKKNKYEHLLISKLLR